MIIRRELVLFSWTLAYLWSVLDSRHPKMPNHVLYYVGTMPGNVGGIAIVPKPCLWAISIGSLLLSFARVYFCPLGRYMLYILS